MTTTGYTVLATTNLLDNRLTTANTGYRVCSTFARWKFSTNAARMVVMAWSTLHPYGPQFEHIGVWINGVPWKVLTFAANGETDFVVDLPWGTKTVELVSGLQMLGGVVVYGTYVRDVYFVGATLVTQELPSAPPNRMVIYGDSIAVGANATYPTQQGWGVLLRKYVPVAFEAWGSRALFQDCPDAAGRLALAAKLAAFAPGRVWLAIGTNDYGLNLWTAANFQTAYADLLVQINAALPAATIYCQTPLQRGTNTANGLGSTLADYRTAIGTAAGGKGYCTLVDGTGAAFPQDPADLDTDRTHPTTAGHARYLAAVRTVLGV